MILGNSGDAILAGQALLPVGRVHVLTGYYGWIKWHVQDFEIMNYHFAKWRKGLTQAHGDSINLAEK